jgi:hypothetical protein
MLYMYECVCIYIYDLAETVHGHLAPNRTALQLYYYTNCELVGSQGVN